MDASVRSALAALRGRLNGQLLVPLVGLEKPLRTVVQLVDRTVLYGESNSLLILGGRGHGKTALLRTALAEVEARCRERQGTMVTVHLDGHALPDDREALYELARQLAVDQELDNRSFGSYAETLAFLLGSLRRPGCAAVPLVLVLNEFDQFALHGKQTLLYNLFDIVQSRGSPMVVLGLTCRLDAVEMLEKRVKSRFSHRQVFVPPPETFVDYCETLVRALTLAPCELPDDPARLAAWNRAVQKAGRGVRTQTLPEDAAFSETALALYDLGKDVRALFQLAFAVVAAIGVEPKALNGAAFVAAAQRAPTDPKVAMLKGISILELTLVVAMRQLRDQRELSHVNFAMVYEEYRSFMAQQPQHSVDLFSKPVALKAFEQLASTELVRAVPSRTAGGWSTGSGSDGRHTWHIPPQAAGLREFVMVELQVETSQVLDAVRQRVDCPVFLRKWALQWNE